MRYNFALWKWRALYRRRYFFFCILQVVLIFTWISNYYFIHDGDLSFNEDRKNSSFTKFYHNLPVLFYLSHSILLLFVLLLKEGGNIIIHETQGKKLCDWSVFSFVFSLIYLLTTKNEVIRKFERTDSILFSNSYSITYSSVTIFGLTIIHHLGISDPLLSIIKYSVVILWITFLNLMIVDWICIITSCIVIITFIVLGSMQEFELYRLFTKQREAINSFYNGVTDGNSQVSIFVEDTISALNAMDSAIIHQKLLLSKDNLLAEEYQRTTLIQSEELFSWKLTSESILLYINKLLCQSLYYAVTSNPHVFDNTTFSFRDLCSAIYALHENKQDRSLTLYVNADNTIDDALICAPKEMFEMVIFLLIHDTVRDNVDRICCVSCEHSDVDGWYIVLKTTSLATVQRDVAPNRRMSNAPPRLSIKSSESILINNENPSDPTTLNKTASDSIATHPQVAVENNTNTTTTTTEPYFNTIDTLTQGLTLDENFICNNKLLERLAERISNKYLKTKIYNSNTEYKSGVKIDQKTIYLSSENCSLVSTTLSPTATLFDASRSSSGNTNTTAKSASINNNITSVPVVDNNEDYLKNESIIYMKQQLLFIVEWPNDLGGLSEIKEKLKVLGVPHFVKSITDQKEKNDVYLRNDVVVIEQNILTKVHKYKDNTTTIKFLLSNITTSWIVICEGKKISSATDIKVIYGIEAECLSSKASMQELFDCIQLATSKLLPRIVDVSQIQSDFVDINLPPVVSIQQSQSQQQLSMKAGANTNQSTHNPSFNLQRKISEQKKMSSVHNADTDAFKRWLFLVRKFKAIASKYHKESLLIASLDSRMKEIQDLKDIRTEEIVVVPENMYTGVLSDLGANKKKAKFIISIYQPILNALHTNYEKDDLLIIQAITASASVKSSNIGLFKLSCWFTTLQEILSITINMIDNFKRNIDGDSSRSYSRSKDSFSLVYTTATTTTGGTNSTTTGGNSRKNSTRSKSNNSNNNHNSNNKSNHNSNNSNSSPSPNASNKAANSIQSNSNSSSSIPVDDVLVLQDVSGYNEMDDIIPNSSMEQEEKSSIDVVDEITKSLKDTRLKYLTNNNINTPSSSSIMNEHNKKNNLENSNKSIVNSNNVITISTGVGQRGTGSTGSFSDGNSKLFNEHFIGLRVIIGDMINAIEIAIWDAAMDR